MSADVVWIGWLVLFLVYEVYAAVSKRSGDTFSENVWRWLGLRGPKRPLSWLRRGVLVAFLGALAWHLVTGGTPLFVIVFGAMFALVVTWAEWTERRAPSRT